LVAKRASSYAAGFKAENEAWLAGILHDLGKYGELFQKRLKGEEQGIDHWSAGAWTALKEYKEKGIAPALAIQGHHVGLRAVSPDSLRQLDPLNVQERYRNHASDLRPSDPDANQLLARFRADLLELPPLDKIHGFISDWSKWAITSMLDVRMLFSMLVDADFIETEAFFQASSDGKRVYREVGALLEPETAFLHLNAYLDELRKASKASSTISQLRSDLLHYCLKAAEMPQGIFTLTAPTGSGKTLAMLAFALKHAITHRLRRVITVIPYLTIIEQTAEIYRKIFKSYLKPEELARYVEEHHSLSSFRHQEDKMQLDNADNQSKLLHENWDAPFIVTTNVQLLESLFANRPGACRKLHRLANSVILFDEVQTLPLAIAIPTLAALSSLAEHYGTTVVFSTATQPAFGHLNDHIKRLSQNGWTPREIVPSGAGLFSRAKRNQVRWPDKGKRTGWPELADKIKAHEQVLCIVNLKRHALELYQTLKQLEAGALFHLSTNMCPAHRKQTLDKVRDCLAEGKPCRLISTQCVEAGVDIDFPVVFRALGPLDAIAQAAGRCNRNGRLESGTVHVFSPEYDGNSRIYPDSAYEQAADVSIQLLNKHGTLDINDPAVFQEYYQQLYSFAQLENQKPALIEAIQRKDFVEVAKNYHVIEQNTINVLVPFEKDIYHRLKNEALNKGVSRNWIMAARPYAIGLFRPKPGDPIESYLKPVASGLETEEWYVYLEEEHYHDELGLIVPRDSNVLIA
jgi:CRISPR-associated helicase Cas3/CRISPR-associated endonuclease Cas3-HD